MYYNKWLKNREHGFSAGQSYIHERVYSSIHSYAKWNGNEHCGKPEIGAVFNLEFSPEGKTLVAACERQSIVVFDAQNAREVERISDAHLDNVNCIKFLSSNLFASGSDDFTVALWDLRNLKNKLRSLHGHMNWVKNIEYSVKDKLLLTSGFDGSVFSWDLESYTEQDLTMEKVFHTSGLMRCRITPNGDKLLICTTGGYIVIVHDLDLTTICKDLSGFRPSIYRLMQMGHQYIPQAAKYEYVFAKTHKRNRVELVSDFPEHDDAEVILALQIHPQGNSFLSRNISYDEKTQWSCVHDINEEPKDTSRLVAEMSSRRKRKLNSLDVNDGEEEDILTNPNTRARRARSAAEPVSVYGNSTRYEQFVPDIWAAEVTVMERATRLQRGGARQASHNSVAGYNFVYAISSGVLQAPHWRRQNPPVNDTNENETGLTPVIVPNAERRIYHNPEKLMFHIEESVQASGYIKEPGYSADGRIICSPYDNGVRLLAYNDRCSEYPTYSLDSRGKSKPLEIVKIYKEHADFVLVSKFSPVAPLLVSACHEGKIVWYNPVL